MRFRKEEVLMDSTSIGSDVGELLTKDHALVKAPMQAREDLPAMDPTDGERHRDAEKIYRLLTSPVETEEELVDPALEDGFGDDGFISEMEIEHSVLEELIDQLKAMDADEAYMPGTL